MEDLRFAFFGAGFWARCQIGAWTEVPGAKCVAIYNRTRSKAEKLAAEFHIPAVYGDAATLLDSEKLDFVDIATSNDTHGPLTKLAAEHKLPVICQKPLAPTLAEAEEMFAACQAAGVPLLVHENWRWQRPIREMKRELESGVIGRPVRATMSWVTGVDDLSSQPFLKELERMLLADMGVHLLDTMRYLFGEPEALWCQNRRVQSDLRGEDLSTIMLSMHNGMTVIILLGLARSPMEKDFYNETLFFIEGDKGTIELAGDYWVRVTTAEGTRARRYPPPRYAWADPAYDLSMAAGVDCHRNLLAHLRGEVTAETRAEDNLKSLRLVEASYASADSGQLVRV